MPGRKITYGKDIGLSAAKWLVPVFFLVWLYCTISYPARLNGLPEAVDYKELEQVLRKEFKPGDCVSLAPFWAERARLYIGDMNILGLRNTTRQDLLACKRIFLVGVFKDDASRERKKIESMSFAKRKWSRPVGRLSLDLFDLSSRSTQTVFDFRKHIKDAGVWIEKGSGKTACDRYENRQWKCPGPEWNYVGDLTTDMDRNPRRCIWAHPVQGGTLKIRFDNVPMGESIQGRHGIALSGLGQNPSDVILRISIDGERQAEFAAHDVLGYFSFKLDTGRFKGSLHQVEFSVSTKNNGARHYCFEAYTIEKKISPGAGS
ncbi:MAG: hypothetical protein GXP49_18435 [Deltaproteobacteria bacterium]|nr:hypothetical protein [Deltaproteobacteria bacterium]